MTKIFFGVGILGLAGALGGYFLYQKPAKQNSGLVSKAVAASEQPVQPQYPRYQEIAKPAGFVNSGKFTIGEFIGKKVVLVDFITYTCINCIRTFPYINAWQDKYKDQGLQIVGIHTPEFAFERKYDNVAEAMKKFGIKFPIVLDNEYATWNAYGNRYWPRKYLIDIDGNIAYDHIGEGAYEETEAKIQELLLARSQKLGAEGKISADMAKPSGVVALDAPGPLSPETYFGSARNEYLANVKSGKVGRQRLLAPKNVIANSLYLVGDWSFAPEYALNRKAGAKIIYKYKAKRVFIVASAKAGANLKIRRDGEPITSSAGKDIQIKNGQSFVRVKADRLYSLIDGDYGEHTLEIIIDRPELQVFTFTFG